MTVHALSYELRRLRGLRSSWLILAAVPVADLAVVLARALAGTGAGGPRGGPDRTSAIASAVRAATGVVPWLPLPVAALAAGVLGVLAYAHDARHPGLVASRVAFGRRAGLIGAKLLVSAVVSAALAAVTLLLGTALEAFALPAAGLRTEAAAVLRHPGATALWQPFAAFALLVLAAGWTGVLAAAVVRRAGAGLALFLALAVALEASAGLVLRRVGRGWPFGAGELLPLRNALGRVPVEGFARAVPDGVLLALPLLPVAVLATVCLALQLRRRAL
ncbi:hypothetical protein [Kitasatospora paranensis]|uniref:ABC transporter permease n=1 Tax=Kitasatospora paranensis TaxID=258053 RepID=A0ABW2G3U4_9ACTN